MKKAKVTSLICLLFAVAACQPASRVQVEERADKTGLAPSSEAPSIVDDESASLTARAIQAHKELKAVYEGINYDREVRKNGQAQLGYGEAAVVAGGMALYASHRLQQIERGFRINALLAEADDLPYSRIFNQVMDARKLSGKKGDINPFEVREQMGSSHPRFANEALEREIADKLNAAVKDARSSETFAARMRAMGPSAVAKVKGMRTAFVDFMHRPSAKKIGASIQRPSAVARFNQATKSAWDRLLFNVSKADEASVLRGGRSTFIVFAAVFAGFSYLNYQEGRDELKMYSNNDDEDMTEFFISSPMGNAALVAMSEEDFAKLAKENSRVAQFTIELNQKLHAAGAAK